LLHDLDTAKALGSPLLRVFPGAVPADISDATWAWAHEAVDYAASLGLLIALENWGKLPGGHLSELSYVLHNIPSQTLKVNVDVGNYAMHGEDVLEAIKVLGERVVYAHLKDKPVMNGETTTYLGGGAFPMDAIVDALEALPQPMLYCFEFDGDGEAEMRIAKSLAYLREEN
jgi:sugar phosphate isomerase/epimerase